jgi:putative transposase
MAKPPRTAISGTFFLTAVTHSRRPLFQLPANAELFLETLQHYRRQGAYKLHDFVVMPDHIHLILTTPNLPAAMKLIKGGFSHRLSSTFPVWQRGYTDHRIRDAADLAQRRRYIHQNPVTAGLVTAPELFPYSSARKDPAHLTPPLR